MRSALIQKLAYSNKWMRSGLGKTRKAIVALFRLRFLWQRMIAGYSCFMLYFFVRIRVLQHMMLCVFHLCEHWINGQGLWLIRDSTYVALMGRWLYVPLPSRGLCTLNFMRIPGMDSCHSWDWFEPLLDLFFGFLQESSWHLGVRVQKCRLSAGDQGFPEHSIFYRRWGPFSLVNRPLRIFWIQQLIMIRLHLNPRYRFFLLYFVFGGLFS